MKKRIICILLFLIVSEKYRKVFAQEVKDSSSIADKIKEFKPSVPEIKDIEIVQMVQAWDATTFENAGNTPNEKRNDLYIRRGRIGVRGKLRKDMSFYVVFAYDGIGRDKSTAGNGNANDGDNHDFFLWDAMWTWHAKSLINVTIGYFRPQVGRENISSAFNVISLEKSLPNFQPRTHIVGRNTGRETGMNIGGFHKGNGWSFNYNLGFFDPTNIAIAGAGTRWFPLLTSRAAITIGDPEMDKYKLSYIQSYYGQRKGITFAGNATYEGETVVFRENSFYGADLLANYKHWDFVAEYDWLYRKSFMDKAGATQNTTDKVYSFKAGYNFITKKNKIIQLTGAYSGLLAIDFGGKPSVNSLTGAADQSACDVGINYLLNLDKLKISLHYLWGKKRDKITDPSFAYGVAGFQYQF